jgi:hypothetical protein
MTASLLHGGRDQLRRLFDEVAEEFNRSGIAGDVLMVGGSWMLWFGLRNSTRDVDSARKDGPALSTREVMCATSQGESAEHGGLALCGLRTKALRLCSPSICTA